MHLEEQKGINKTFKTLFCVAESECSHTFTDRKVFSSGKPIPNQWLNFITKGRRNWRNSHSEKSLSYLLFVTYFPLRCRSTSKVLSRGTKFAPSSGPEESIKWSNFYFNSYPRCKAWQERGILQREDSLALNRSLLKGKQLLNLWV